MAKMAPPFWQCLKSPALECSCFFVVNVGHIPDPMGLEFFQELYALYALLFHKGYRL